MRDGVKNTGRIDQLLREANGELLELDAMMHNKYTRQPDTLRAWQTASRVERAPRREKKPAVAVIPVAAGTPTPQPKVA